MARTNNSTTISIDSERATINFYTLTDNNKDSITHYVKSYAGGRLDDAFFERFREAVKEFAEKYPSGKIQKITVVLPDNAAITDTIKIPTMKDKLQTKKTLDITLNSLFRNYDDLRISSRIIEQNKQYSTFAVSAVQKRIAAGIYSACSENKFLVETLTTASNAVVCGALQLNPKLKNASYLFLDFKDIYARFVFVVKGKAVGSYTLPFGLEFLGSKQVIQEDMLFDHSYAELMVLNARERAKAKKLTVMAADPELFDAEEEVDNSVDTFDFTTDNSLPEDETEEIDPNEAEAVPSQPALKLFTKKGPRKLPKFMQREIPYTPDGVLYENFRIFIKWALELINNNRDITSLAKFDTVYVNMPDEYRFLFEVVNQKQAGRGIVFLPLLNEGEYDSLAANLELYGGFFMNRFNEVNTF